jgi:hypothetical protein
VLAVKGMELATRDAPQPNVKRGVGLDQIGGQGMSELEKRLLKHVGGIEPAVQPMVQPKLDHSPQPTAIQSE